MTDLVYQTGEKLFRKYADAAFAAHAVRAAEGAAAWLPELWQELCDAGFPNALLAEEDGGFGIAPVEALGLVRQAAAYAAPVPLAETLLGNWLLARSGIGPVDGVATTAAGATVVNGRVRGEVLRVPYARHATVLALLAEDENGDPWIAVIDGWPSVRHGHNLAGEARDTLSFDDVVPSAIARSPIDRKTFQGLGATMRTQAIAGAAAAALSQTVAYANERPQFGKPIGKFQAIQQNLAVMAGQVAAAQVSADMAAEALPLASTDPEAFLVTAAAAKSRASEAASIVAEIAHQAHGAMGFSHECRLHLATRRLWSARDEFGSESYWNEQLGRRVFDKGAEALWPYLTDIAGVAG